MADGAPVTVTELRPAALAVITAWPGTVAAVEAAITTALGAPPPSVGHGYADQGAKIAAVSPGRYFLASNVNDIVARLADALPAVEGAATDVSHGYTIFRIEGEAAADLLSRCIAVDLDAAVFPPGRVARTPIHHIDVLVHRLSATGFDLWVSRSFAESLAEWILDAGLEFPIAFRGPDSGPASRTDMPLS